MTQNTRIDDSETVVIEIASFLDVYIDVQTKFINSEIWQFVRIDVSDSNDNEYHRSKFTITMWTIEWSTQELDIFQLVIAQELWTFDDDELLVEFTQTMRTLFNIDDERDDVIEKANIVGALDVMNDNVDVRDVREVQLVDESDEIDELLPNDVLDQLDEIRLDVIDEIDERELHTVEEIMNDLDDDDEVDDDDEDSEIDEIDERDDDDVCMLHTRINHNVVCDDDEIDEILDCDEDDDNDDKLEAIVQLQLDSEHFVQLDEIDDVDTVDENDEHHTTIEVEVVREIDDVESIVDENDEIQWLQVLEMRVNIKSLETDEMRSRTYIDLLWMQDV